MSKKCFFEHMASELMRWCFVNMLYLTKPVGRNCSENNHLVKFFKGSC